MTADRTTLLSRDSSAARLMVASAGVSAKTATVSYQGQKILNNTVALFFALDAK
jgi:hypothetical protein